MRTLCFGGSFNPIHHGHLITARAVAEAGKFRRVLLIPSAQPPHKSEVSDLASAEQRLALCRLAVENDPLFEVSDIEIRRAGPSYTIDTARQLRDTGLDSIHWLIGADMAMFLPHWHQADRLLDEVRFTIMARPGVALDWSVLPLPFQHLREHVVVAPLIEISSTNIRHRIAAGLSIRNLTPVNVVEYIDRHNLYRPNLMHT